MSFYTGSTADGSDMRQVGMYQSPCGNYWSSEPFPPTKEEEKDNRLYWQLREHINGKRSFSMELQLVYEKKSTLPRAVRDYLMRIMNDSKPTDNEK